MISRYCWSCWYWDLKSWFRAAPYEKALQVTSVHRNKTEVTFPPFTQTNMDKWHECETGVSTCSGWGSWRRTWCHWHCPGLSVLLCVSINRAAARIYIKQSLELLHMIGVHVCVSTSKVPLSRALKVQPVLSVRHMMVISVLRSALCLTATIHYPPSLPSPKA